MLVITIPARLRAVSPLCGTQRVSSVLSNEGSRSSNLWKRTNYIRPLVLFLMLKQSDGVCQSEQWRQGENGKLEVLTDTN